MTYSCNKAHWDTFSSHDLEYHKGCMFALSMKISEYFDLEFDFQTSGQYLSSISID